MGVSGCLIRCDIVSHHNSKENDMKQRELWENQKIVKDPQQIKAYLAQCLRILKGEELCVK